MSRLLRIVVTSVVAAVGHQMVHELGKALEGKVEVIDCMVDRICVDRQILPDAIAVSVHHPLVPLINADKLVSDA